MSENYTYGGDRRLASLTDLNDTAGSNPPVTLRFLSRSFWYDQVGRVSQVYSPHTAPLNQTYDYDEFGNMKGRSGSYYWQPSQSDAGSFNNNRRNGWSYSADGQVTANPASITDNAHTFNYDAANRLTNSNETIGSGTSSYSPAYDGDGKVVYESQVATGTLASSSSSYAVRATVLGSQILTRLDQNGNKLVTYVPAEGLLFVTQNVSPNGNWVGWTQRDPVGISETGKGIYDPLGNYIPFQQHDDPRPPVGSYNSSSMGGFYASFASNPFQLNIGCIRDGIPTDCNKVLNDINHGLAGKVIIGGTQNPNVVLANAGFIPQVRSQEVRPNFSDPLDERNAFHFAVDTIDSVAIVPGSQPTPQKPYDPREDFRDYAEGLSKDTSISDCQKLALMIYKAGQVFGGSNPFSDSGRGIINGLMAGLTEFTAVNLGGREGPSNPNYRVGVFRNDPHYGGGFGASGFSPGFVDPSNQVRHFTFYLGAGWGIGSTLANQGLYREEGTSDPRVADVGLGLAATDLGSRFNGNYTQLAQDVWHRVCGQSGDLKLP